MGRWVRRIIALKQSIHSRIFKTRSGVTENFVTLGHTWSQIDIWLKQCNAEMPKNSKQDFASIRLAWCLLPSLVLHNYIPSDDVTMSGQNQVFSIYPVLSSSWHLCALCSDHICDPQVDQGYHEARHLSPKYLRGPEQGRGQVCYQGRGGRHHQLHTHRGQRPQRLHRHGV